MEEFQEADILWPGSDDNHRIHNAEDEDDNVVDDEPTTSSDAPMPSSSVRPKASTASSAAPVEISRRKRRCRPWSASEYPTFDDQETDDVVSGDEEGRLTDEANLKGATTNGLRIVPPHVLVARRRSGRSSRTAAYSMCAGRGRTLKGRDLRDVRNLVLKMTGFIEK